MQDLYRILGADFEDRTASMERLEQLLAAIQKHADAPTSDDVASIEREALDVAQLMVLIYGSDAMNAVTRLEERLRGQPFADLVKSHVSRLSELGSKETDAIN